MIRVFLSSVSVGLEDIRAQIIDDLRTANFDIGSMEQFGAQPTAPIDVCLREVRKADVVVLLIGPRYGSLLPQGISYTHAEFRAAQGAGIPVLGFRLPHASGLASDERHRLDSFVTEVSSTVLYDALSPDDSLERLYAKVQIALSSARDRGDLGHRFSFFQKYERFFSLQLGDKPAFVNHEGPFIGRDHQLKRLTAFINGSEPLLLLKAPGGSGKSRLLLEAAKNAQQQSETPRILFVDSAATWSAGDINLLPTVPLVLIFDDAHRRPDLDRLIAACQQRNESIRYLVSCRPSAVGIVRPLVAQLVTSTEPPELDLPRLTKDDAEALARHYLGPSLSHLAERLIRIADRNPLVTRVGARCIANNLVIPEVLERTPDVFRRLVLDRLLDDPGLTASDATARGQILEIIAAIGPIVTENNELLEELSKRVNLPVHDVSRLIAILERNQFLMRRGRLVRVTPDVLADHLLYRAAVDENGTPTGFVEAMVNSFRASMDNILANAAELDWRSTATSHHESVLKEIWHDMLQLLPTLSNRQRAELVGQLKRAGDFAPAEVLSICEWIIDNPDAPKDELLAQWGLQDTSEKLTDTLTDVVAFIATHPDFTKRCAAQLWKLATLDERPEGPHPDHPRRRLGELVQYKATSELKILDGVQARAIEVLIQQLQDTSRTESATWAVSTLAGALGRTGEANEWNRHVLTLREFSLASVVPQLVERRNEVIESLAVVARGTRLDEAATALRELSTLLQPPRGPFGRGLDASEISVWQPEAERAISLLQSIAGSANSEVIRFLARRELRSARQDYWPQIAPSLQNALTEIAPVSSEEVYDLLVGLPREERLHDYAAEEGRIDSRCTAAAEIFWRELNTPPAVVDALLMAMSAFHGIGRGTTGHAGRLVRAIVLASSHDPRELIRELVAHEAGRPLLRSALLATHEKDPAVAEAIATELTTSDHADIRTSVLEAIQWMIDGATNLPALVDLARQLSQDPVVQVRAATVGVLCRLAKHSQSDALAILIAINWDGSLSLAETVLGALSPQYGVDPSELADTSIDTFLTRVERLPRLERHDWELLEFLEFASRRRPVQTVEMLLRRVSAVDDHRDDQGSERWLPLPYSGHGVSLSGVHDAAEHADLVRLVRDAGLDASGRVQFWLHVLFQLTDPKLSAGRSALLEWAASGEQQKIVGAAGFLRDFDHSLVFSEHELIAELLAAANKCGVECLRYTKSELCALATSGIYSGTPGQPAPRHVHEKAEAERLANVYASNDPVHEFYRSLIVLAEANMRIDVDIWEDGEEE